MISVPAQTSTLRSSDAYVEGPRRTGGCIYSFPELHLQQQTGRFFVCVINLCRVFAGSCEDSVMNRLWAGSSSQCRSGQVHAVMLNLLSWLLGICFPPEKHISEKRKRHQPLKNDTSSMNRTSSQHQHVQLSFMIVTLETKRWRKMDKILVLLPDVRRQHCSTNSFHVKDEAVQIIPHWMVWGQCQQPACHCH